MELYLHIPYCRQKCRYCDFASYAGRADTMSRYVSALLHEAEALQNQGERMDTVFIGGGTPSLLPPELLERLLTGLRRRFCVAPGAEWSSEANPGTLTRPWLDVAVAGGVNRLSLGLQAAQQPLLTMLGRIHTLAQAEEAVKLARDAGIRNLNLDLMFGLPGQTPEMWRETLHVALSLAPEHLSCYGLIPEEGTPLQHDLETGRLHLPAEEDERRMYDDALNLLAAVGFNQYEISNFALPGYACRHNVGYWRRVPYLGLGASAASLYARGQGSLRTANPPGIDAYLRMVETEDWSAREITPVSAAEARFETMMLGLRMTSGVSEEEFQAAHGVSLRACYGERLEKQRQAGLVDFASGRWFLTRRGMDVQNAVLVELMD